MHKNFRTFNFLLILTFVSSLFFPLLFIHNRAISDIEKRKLAPFPQVIWNGEIKLNHEIITTFPSKFEAFYNDHFGFRDHLVKLYSLLCFIVKSASSPNVLIGQKGWMFFVGGNSVEDYRGNDPLSPLELWQWRVVLEAKKAWLEKRGVKYVFIIAPDKHSIYPEYFPSRINKVGKYSRLDQFLAYMNDSEAPFVDLRPSLLQAKTKGLVYYKTNSHWNLFGAAVAQYTIVQQLASGHFAFHPIKFAYNDFQLVQHSGDIAQMLNLSPFLQEMAPNLRNPLPLCKSQIIEERPDYPSRSTVMIECENDSPTALIFRDSFFTGLQPYMSHYFSKSLYVWKNPNFIEFEQYIKRYSPDIVIEERVERDLQIIPALPTFQNEIYNEFLGSWWRTGRTVYKLAGNHREQISSVHQATIFPTVQGYTLRSHGNDSNFQLPKFKTDIEKQYIMKIEIEAPQATKWQIFYSESEKLPKYNENNCTSGQLQRGDNTLFVLTKGKKLKGQIRFDPGTAAGDYVLKTIEVRSVETQ